jgi:hypothetical protein
VRDAIAQRRRKSTGSSAALELTFMSDWGDHATLGHMEHIAGIVIGCAAALLFALMAWAGQHQS